MLLGDLGQSEGVFRSNHWAVVLACSSISVSSEWQRRYSPCIDFVPFSAPWAFQLSSVVRYQLFLIACSHRRHRQDKTVLSCLVRVGGVNTIGDKTRPFCLVSTQFPISKFSVLLNIFETKQDALSFFSTPSEAAQKWKIQVQNKTHTKTQNGKIDSKRTLIYTEKQKAVISKLN